jgi:tetratricopeptide (TPR) repeat protein
VAAEPAAAAAIAAGCGHLPLALCIAGARLSARPDLSLADFRDRLAEQRHRLDSAPSDGSAGPARPGRRLDELTAGDLDVRASIELSYRALEPPLATLFRRLGLVTAPDWPAWVAGVLTDPVVAAGTGGSLARLVDVHLVEELDRDGAGQRRYRMHDLVAEFAAELVGRDEPAGERDAALDRLLDGWLGAASLADDELGISGALTTGLTDPGPPAAAAGTIRGAPNEWFEAERAALLATSLQASQRAPADAAVPSPARADRAAALALRVAGFLATRTYDDDREAVLTAALAAVRAAGGDGMRARLLGALFALHARLDRLDRLPALAAEQLAVARRLGDRNSEVRALMQLGMLARRQGRLAEAARVLDEAADQSAGLPVLVRTTVMASRAVVYLEEGRPAAALPLSTEALRLQRTDRSPRMIGMRLLGHAETLLGLGRLADAEQAFAGCRELLCESDTDLAAGLIDTRLAELHLRRGDPAGAGRLLDRAMATYEQHDDTGGRADVLRCRGELAEALGDPAGAVPPLRESLALYRRIGQPLDEARLLARLARVRTAVGDPTAAAADTARYQAILADLNLDEAALRLPPP